MSRREVAQERRAAREQAKLNAEAEKKKRNSNQVQITKYRDERLRYLKRRLTIGAAVFVLRSYLKGELFSMRENTMAEIIEDRGTDVMFPYTVRWYEDGLTMSTLPEQALNKVPRQKHARKQLRIKKKEFMAKRHHRGDIVRVLAPALKRMGAAYVSQEGKSAVVTMDLGPGYAFPYKVKWEADELASPSHCWISAPELVAVPPPALKLVDDDSSGGPPAQWYYQEAGASDNSWTKFPDKQAILLEKARQESSRGYRQYVFARSRMLRRDHSKLALSHSR